jgi:hypothetical protein
VADELLATKSIRKNNSYVGLISGIYLVSRQRRRRAGDRALAGAVRQAAGGQSQFSSHRAGQRPRDVTGWIQQNLAADLRVEARRPAGIPAGWAGGEALT